jgi:DNA adenine methylase
MSVSRDGSGVLPPPLKWAGGKRWQVPRLQAMWAPHAGRRLVEPFCGGLAVALGLSPERALLNDANAHLVNFYRWLKRGLVVDLPMANERTMFYGHRSRFNDLLERGQGRTRESACLFYYLNRTGYNGLCRFNRRGQFNVPFGRYARRTTSRSRSTRSWVSPGRTRSAPPICSHATLVRSCSSTRQPIGSNGSIVAWDSS